MGRNWFLRAGGRNRIRRRVRGCWGGLGWCGGGGGWWGGGGGGGGGGVAWGGRGGRLGGAGGGGGGVRLIWAKDGAGVVFDIQEVGELCRRFGVVLHVDGVQAVGKM